MNRRSYIKGILAIGTLGATSFSIFKWVDFYKPFRKEDLLNKRSIIAELAELIIPATETPGAKSANVHDYIINVLINCNPIGQQKKFLAGIEDLQAYTISNYNKDFLKCSETERNETLGHFANHSGYSNRTLNKINNKIFGEPFYAKLRSLTIEGYCLSQVGATQGLAYDYIPQKFEACIPLLPHQKSWATK